MRQKTSNVSNPLLLYVAGLFDIGGCVRIDTPKGANRASLYVWITSKHFELMDFLQNFGARVDRKADGNYRAKWRNRKAGELLTSLLPHLKVRRDQAKCGIEFMIQREQDTDDKEDIIYKLRLRLLKREEGN